MGMVVCYRVWTGEADGGRWDEVRDGGVEWGGVVMVGLCAGTERCGGGGGGVGDVIVVGWMSDVAEECRGRVASQSW